MLQRSGLISTYRKGYSKGITISEKGEVLYRNIKSFGSRQFLKRRNNSPNVWKITVNLEIIAMEIFC